MLAQSKLSTALLFYLSTPGLAYGQQQINAIFFAQASSYVYDSDHNGFDKTQVDVPWTGGLSYMLSY